VSATARERVLLLLMYLGTAAAGYGVLAATGQVATVLAWPGGIIVGNLLASVVWAAPAMVHLHRKMERHHAERMKALAGHAEDLAAIRRHLEAPGGCS
jgi:hypothetical protein